MTPIRVLHFRREVPTGGGPETLIGSISRCLDRSQFDLSVAIFGGPTTQASPLLEMVRQWNTPTVVLPAKHRFDVRVVGSLRRVLDERRIDVLHTHDHRTNLIGYWATRGRPTRLVATLHQPLRRHWWLWPYEVFDDHLVRRFDRLLPVAEAIRQEVLVKRPDLVDRVITVHNGVELSRCQSRRDPAALREELGIPRDAVLFASIGRLSDDKGIDYLLDAARRVLDARDDVSWMIAGRGPLAEKLKARNQRLGLTGRVLFIGFRTDVPDLLAACDVLVIASTSEGCSVAALEAMAAGRPVIATRVGGSPEIVEHQVTGVIVEPRRVDQLAEAMLSLANSPAGRARMGAEAAERARTTFSDERMVRRFEQVYRELMTQPSPMRAGRTDIAFPTT